MYLSRFRVMSFWRQDGVVLRKFSVKQIVTKEPHSEKQVRRLANALLDENVESPYLDKLRGEVVSGESLISGLEQEMRGEIARALKETEDKVNWALLQCDLVARSEEQRTAEDIRLHKHWRQEAIRARTNLIIHRQACGFRLQCHATVYRLFPIPKPLI